MTTVSRSPTSSSVTAVGLVSRAVRAARLLVVEMGTGFSLTIGAIMLGFALLGGSVVSLGLATSRWVVVTDTALTGTLYLAPLAAGAAVWGHQDTRRRHLDALAATTPRGRLAPVLLRGSAVLAWGSLGCLALGFIVLLRISVRGGPGVPALLVLALAIMSLAAVITVGLAIAALTTNRLAAPATAVVVFAWMFALAYVRDSWLIHLAPNASAASTFYPSYLQPRTSVIAMQLLGLAGLALLVASWPLLQRGVARLAGTVVGAISLTVAVAVLSGMGPASTELRGPPDDPSCASTAGVRLCLRPVNAELVTPASQALARTARALDDYFSAPNKYHAPGMGPHPNRRHGPGIYIPPARAATPLLRQAAVEAVLPVRTCQNMRQIERGAKSYRALTNWVRAVAWNELPRAEELRKQINRVREWPMSRQQQWINERIADVRACGG